MPCVKRLEAAGVSLAHAEALADAMGDIVLQSITTKTDLREVDLGLRAEMKELSTSLRAEMKDMELRLTLRIAAMLVFVMAVISALKIFA